MQTEVQTPATDALQNNRNMIELGHAFKQPETNPLRMQAGVVGDKSRAHLAAVELRGDATEKLEGLKRALPRLSSEFNALITELRKARADDVSALITSALSDSKLTANPNTEIERLERQQKLVSDSMKHLTLTLIPEAELDLEAVKIDCLRAEAESLSAWASFKAGAVAVRMGEAVSFDDGISVNVGPETAELTKRADEMMAQWHRAKADFDERRLQKQNATGRN